MFTARQSEGLWAFVWPGAGGVAAGAAWPARREGPSSQCGAASNGTHAKPDAGEGAQRGRGRLPLPHPGAGPTFRPRREEGAGSQVSVTSRESSPGAAELSQLFHSSANSFIMDLRGFHESEGCRAVVSGRNAS